MSDKADGLNRASSIETNPYKQSSSGAPWSKKERRQQIYDWWPDLGRQNQNAKGVMTKPDKYALNLARRKVIVGRRWSGSYEIATQKKVDAMVTRKQLHAFQRNRPP